MLEIVSLRQTFLHHHDPSQAQLALLELSPRRCPYTMVAWDPGSLFGVEPPGLIFLSLLLRLLSSICSGCSPCLVPSSSVHPQLLRDLLILIHTRECSLFSFLPEYSTGKDNILFGVALLKLFVRLLPEPRSLLDDS